MRCRILLHIVLWVFPTVVVANNTAETGLKLEAKVASARYCKLDVESDANMIMNFKVNFTNANHKDLTLSPPFYPVLLVSGSVTDLNKKTFEFTLHGPDFFARDSDKDSRHDQVLHTSVLLRPGQSFESETMETVVPISRTESKRVALRPGVHFFEVVIQGQLTDTHDFVRFTSNPIKILIGRNPHFQTCR
jgi:hypothetical protein